MQKDSEKERKSFNILPRFFNKLKMPQIVKKLNIFLNIFLSHSKSINKESQWSQSGLGLYKENI